MVETYGEIFLEQNIQAFSNKAPFLLQKIHYSCLYSISANKETISSLFSKDFNKSPPHDMADTSPPAGSGGPLLKQRGCFSLVFRLTPPTKSTESSDAVGRPRRLFRGVGWRVTWIFRMDAVSCWLRHWCMVILFVMDRLIKRYKQEGIHCILKMECIFLGKVHITIYIYKSML